ncbi:MAG: tRNA (adenosine(37)-N6)-threonylcarbamoyltransferase complex ATPase subunit type 1 TsaE [Planctomycetaceae bacterium]
MRTLTIDVPDEAALAPLARALMAALPRGAFVALTGDLGAGKTTFVKACAAAAGIDPAEVVSPTFGLIHVHAGPRGRLIHADVYRLPDVNDLHETGWDDTVATADCTFLEWPERIAAALPEDRLDVAIAITGPTSRAFTLTSRGPVHDRVVAAVAETR